MRISSTTKDGLYPIRVAIKLTGLTADTIRVWERRYRAIEPARTAGNTRMYSSADIRRLSRLKEATARGHRIHEVAQLSEEELDRLVGAGAKDVSSAIESGSTGGPSDAYASIMDEYLAAVVRFDVRRAQQILSRAAAVMNTTDFTQHLLVPILRSTGHKWAQDKMNVAQEHLVSAQVRSLLVRITDLASARPGSFKIIIATPEGHLHEFGALIGATIASGRGFEPIYLGAHLPESDMLRAVDASRANVLLLSVLRNMDAHELDEFNAMLRRLAARVETWVGLPKDHAARGAVPEVRYLTSFEDLDVLLTRQFI